MNQYNLSNPTPAPSGDGCKDCLSSDGWWVHLRRCLECGQIGCCNSSPSQHAKKHWQESGHKLIMTYEPEQAWFYDWSNEQMVNPPSEKITPPLSHPIDQSAPGPEYRVPDNWEGFLNY
ncbi:UBP-type zinc finger domain-containing protein [Candidatus Saccharibacteria bacterium]|nr:UBP-type zinc finger domain-containing protein [Candidatus Saccharibacteria bacterium]